MRFARRFAKVEKTVRALPDPIKEAQQDAASWQWRLTADLCRGVPEGCELLEALAPRVAHDELGDTENYEREDEPYHLLSTEEIFARYSAFVEELMAQHGLKDIEEWVPTTYVMPVEYEARRRAARLETSRPCP